MRPRTLQAEGLGAHFLTFARPRPLSMQKCRSPQDSYGGRYSYGDPSHAHRARAGIWNAPTRSHPEVHGARCADLPGTDRQDAVSLLIEGSANQRAAVREGIAPPSARTGAWA